MIDAIDTETQNLQRMWDRFSDASTSGVGGARTEQAAKKAVKEVTTLIASDSNLRVRTANAGQNEPGRVVGMTGSPELDEPASRTNMDQNLEKLLLYLQLDNDERQIEAAQNRLEAENTALEAKHADKAIQIKSNIDAMDAAARQQKLMKILGWAMVGVAVAVAVATGGAAIAAMGAATAVAGAAGAGGAVAATTATTAAATTATTAAATTATTAAATTATTAAATTATTAATTTATSQVVAQGAQIAAKQLVTKAVQSAVTATLSTGFQVMNETGATEKATEAVTNLFKSMGLSERSATIAASVSVALFQIGATIGGTAGAGAIANSAQGLTSVAKEVGKTTFNSMAKEGLTALKAQSKTVAAVSSASFQNGLKVGFMAPTAINVGLQGYSSYTNYENAMAQADTTEMDAVLKMIEQMMNETTEELNQLLAQVEALFGKMAGIISSSMETEKEIATNMGNMA